MSTLETIKVCLFLALISTLAFSQMPTWKDLKLLVSTEKDIVALGGEEEKPKWGSHRQFKLTSELRLDVEFEQVGFCSGSDSKWNVPKNTVVDLTLYFLPPIPIGELGLDLSGFKEHRPKNDIPSIFYLWNEEKGAVLEVREVHTTKEALVQSLRLSPPKSQGHLRCSGTKE